MNTPEQCQLSNFQSSSPPGIDNIDTFEPELKTKMRELRAWCSERSSQITIHSHTTHDLGVTKIHLQQNAGQLLIELGTINHNRHIFLLEPKNASFATLV